MDGAWWYVGSAAAISAVGVFWSYFRSVYQQLVTRVVVTITYEQRAAEAVMLKLNKEFTASKFGNLTYRGFVSWRRSSARMEVVVGELIGGDAKFYWRGWVPLLVSRQAPEKNESDYGTAADRPLQIRFFRGTLNPDDFTLDCVDDLNRSLSAFSEKRHFYVEVITGSAGKTVLNDSGPAVAYSGDGSRDSFSFWTASMRLLGCAHSDLQPGLDDPQKRLSNLALSDSAKTAIADLAFWRKNQRWYRDHSLQWNLKWLFEGPPGTGKTETVKAIGEAYELPIFVFDLSTLRNDELRGAWRRVQASSPCIALFEDIDGIYHGRELVKDGPSFDSFLNCLSGAEEISGVVTILTSNHPEKLDQAINADQDGTPSRPGRVDRRIHFGKLDKAGREQIAARILDEAEDWERKLIVDAHPDVTGAQFEWICAEKAKKIRQQREADPAPEKLEPALFAG